MTDHDQTAGLSESDARLLAANAARMEIDALMASDAAQDVRRYLAADGNGVGWRDVLVEIGGVRQLPMLLDDDGKPHPERINAVVDRIFARTATRKLAGGITMTTRPRNRG